MLIFAGLSGFLFGKNGPKKNNQKKKYFFSSTQVELFFIGRFVAPIDGWNHQDLRMVSKLIGKKKHQNEITCVFLKGDLRLVFFF